MDDSSPFSICDGGILHRALRQVAPAGSARGRPVLVGILFAIGWLPLLVLSATHGTLINGVDHPLLYDFGVWARYVVVVPIMVAGEPVADQILGTIVDLFRRTGVVQSEDLPRFEECVRQAQGRARSSVVELALLVTALALPHLMAASLPSPATGSAWFGTVSSGEVQSSPAGIWYTWISLPLVQFLMLRWLWRILVWWSLLWRVAKLHLTCAAGHPDGAGGLGFLSWSPRAFRTVAVGFSVVAAGSVSNQIQFGGTTLLDARGAIIAFVLIESLLLLSPQFFFAKGLVRARYSALAGYGLTASAISGEFERRWTGPSAGRGLELLQSSEPSTVADYSTAFGLVRTMRPVPISIREVAVVVLPLLAPFAPLLLYQYSLKQILQQVLQLVR